MKILGAPLVFLIRAYQLVLSPVLPMSCRFEPSCSEYALAAVRRFGLPGGAYLMIRRLVRCQPWGGCGHDPVPDSLEQVWPWSLGRRKAGPGCRGIH